MVVALLVLSALAGWWVRSLDVTDTATLALTSTTGLSVMSWHGTIQVEGILDVPIPMPLATGVEAYPLDPIERLPLFGVFRGRVYGSTGFGFVVAVPHWLPILLVLAIFTTVRVLRRRSGFWISAPE